MIGLRQSGQPRRLCPRILPKPRQNRQVVNIEPFNSMPTSAKRNALTSEFFKAKTSRDFMCIPCPKAEAGDAICRLWLAQ
jgi:hypothetical protein